MTMFGVTTPCVQQVVKLLEKDWEPLVFHATGIGGRSMEKLIDSGLMRGVIDVSTTEICDMMMGGILAGHRRPLRRDHPHAPSLCRPRSVRSTW